MEITSKPKYICKQVGFLLLIIGSIAMFIQSFLLASIIFALSLVFQIIGWKEPLLTDKWIKDKDNKNTILTQQKNFKK